MPNGPSGEDVYPERETPNGSDSPGADPDQQDHPVDSPNGKGE